MSLCFLLNIKNRMIAESKKPIYMPAQREHRGGTILPNIRLLESSWWHTEKPIISISALNNSLYFLSILKGFSRASNIIYMLFNPLSINIRSTLVKLPGQVLTTFQLWKSIHSFNFTHNVLLLILYQLLQFFLYPKRKL